VEVGPGRRDALVDSADGVVVHGAGPGAEVTIETVHPVTGETYTLGGTLAGNNAARIDSWRRLRALIGV
jgi:hypothetical protein